MHTLDRLICDIALAQTNNLAQVRDIAVFSDPHGSLVEFAIAHLQRCPSSRLFIGSRDLLETFAALDLADNAGVEDRVFAAGYETEIQLDIFFDDARAGFNGRIAPAEIDLALTHLPKSLEELRYFARALAGAGKLAKTEVEALAESAAQPLVFVAGGNNKHMARSQNEVLAEAFAQVQASRGRGKFRCLVGIGAIADVQPYQPRIGKLSLPCLERPAALYGVGGVFSGGKADHGGELLAQIAITDFLRLLEMSLRSIQPQRVSQARRREFTLLDLGCGNGLVSRAFADVFPRAQIFDTDISADAITSTHLTMLFEILDGRVKISWDDAAHSIPDGEMDLVLLNPPFHHGTEIDPTLVQHLLDAAQRKLRANGLLYFVHNSHLRYRPELEARFSVVEELARNTKFTILRASK